MTPEQRADKVAADMEKYHWSQLGDGGREFIIEQITEAVAAVAQLRAEDTLAAMTDDQRRGAVRKLLPVLRYTQPPLPVLERRMTTLTDTIEAVLADPLDGTGHCALLDRLTEEAPDPHRAALGLVLKHPENDGPRLLYAEWCTRNAGRVLCVRCAGGGTVEQTAQTRADQLIWVNGRAPFGTLVCPACGGAGDVPGVLADRAEFIRLQVEKSRIEEAEHKRVMGTADGRREPHSGLGGVNDATIDLHNSTPSLRAGGEMVKCACRHCTIRRREKEIFARNSINQLEWMGKGVHNLARAGTAWIDHLEWFRRGFVEAITCTAADWLKHADAIRAQQPVTKVVLTTWPDAVESQFNRERYHLFLEDRWPGITFELPPSLTFAGHVPAQEPQPHSR